MITVLPSAQAITVGSTAIYAVVVSSDNFDDRVNLASSVQSGGFAPGPQGISITLDPPSGRPTFIARLRVATTAQVQPQTLVFVVIASTEKLVRSASVNLNIVAIGGPIPAGGTFAIAAWPLVRTVNPGQSTNYQVAVTSVGGFSGNVSLVTSVIPPGTVATFSPATLSLAGGDVSNSTLTISTTAATLPRTYGLKVTGISGTTVQGVDITLVVSGGRLSLIVVASASVSVSGSNASVTITGTVTDSGNNLVQGVDVSIQVVDPPGNPVRVNLRLTDSTGTYADSFPLPISTNGIFTVFVTASKAGFRDGRTDATFVIGQAGAPSISVRLITIADVNGNPKNNFRLSDTIRIIVQIDNRGSDLNGLIWIQLEDPSGTPILIQRQQTKISGSITFGPLDLGGSRLLITPGIHKVTLFVSDKLISEGGRFFTSATSTFTAS